jgi:hypothetical protein
VALLALDLLTTSSPLPFWRRLLTLEDTCAYGLCVLIPAVVYLVVLLLRWTLGKKPG